MESTDKQGHVQFMKYPGSVAFLSNVSALSVSIETPLYRAGRLDQGNTGNEGRSMQHEFRGIQESVFNSDVSRSPARLHRHPIGRVWPELLGDPIRGTRLEEPPRIYLSH